MAMITMPETVIDMVSVSDGTLTEWIDGKIVEILPMGGFPAELASKIAGSLDIFARANKLGRAISEILIRIYDASAYRPDVVFVSDDKWPLKLRVPDKKPWSVVPDLVVEVASEYDRA